MKNYSLPRSLLLAGAFIGVFTLSAAGQQPANPPTAAAPAAAAPLPPGSPLLGRPAGNEAAAKLAPVAPPPIPAAVDKLPLAKLKVPAGFNIEVYASGMANARSLAVGDKGTVFVGSRLLDKVYAIVNKDGTRSMPSSTRTASERSRFLRQGFIGRMASHSRTARSTSPNSRRSPRSTRSRMSSTIRRSRR